LSQLAAGGLTSDGWNDFKAGWSGGALRIGTIRAPVGNGFGRDAKNGNRDGRAPRQCPSRAANGSLGWTNGAKGVSIPFHDSQNHHVWTFDSSVKSADSFF